MTISPYSLMAEKRTSAIEQAWQSLHIRKWTQIIRLTQLLGAWLYKYKGEARAVKESKLRLRPSSSLRSVVALCEKSKTTLLTRYAAKPNDIPISLIKKPSTKEIPK